MKYLTNFNFYTMYCSGHERMAGRKFLIDYQVDAPNNHHNYTFSINSSRGNHIEYILLIEIINTDLYIECLKKYVLLSSACCNICHNKYR